MGLLDRWTKKTAVKEPEHKGASKAKLATAVKAEIKADSVEKVEAQKVASAVSYRIVIRPLVTEKAAVAQSQNKYSFIVAHWATKVQVKRAIQELYGVKSLAVNMVNAQGKSIRFGKNHGRRADVKKAIVTLPAGKSITIHEGV